MFSPRLRAAARRILDNHIDCIGLADAAWLVRRLDHDDWIYGDSVRIADIWPSAFRDLGEADAINIEGEAP